MIKKEDLEKIHSALLGAMSKAEKLNSIDEKRQHYINYLSKVIDLLDLSEDVNPLSDEILEHISDNFLSINIQKPIIFEDEGYTPWLNDELQNIEWNFYNRYEDHLLKNKGWKPSDVFTIRESSNIILDHMGNPRDNKLFGKQGLVVGDIQSGKTANYTALINKAIDVGYKLIIVLAGITRDLRNQTQNRLDSEVLGYQTRVDGSRGKPIGVGTIKQLSIEGLTYADNQKDYGDMKKNITTHTLDDTLNPLVMIVKKNKSVLKHLLDFLSDSQTYCYTNNKLNIPVLIIDDEVDQASIDTKNSETIETSSAINQMIRKILCKLNRYSYVGYTATPFANIFVDPDKDNDIYPKDFILTIPTSKDYCGVKEYFGINIKSDDYISDHVADLFVNVSDYADLFGEQNKINAQSSSDQLNESLKDAIISYIIACSIKKSRGIIGPNSMLIHIARFKNPSTTLKPLVMDYINKLLNKLKYEYDNEIIKYKTIWETKFKDVSKQRLGKEFNDKWDNIEKHISNTLFSISINTKVLNGDSDDIIDYSINKTGDYIVIGGDKLSRGLTLEGLVISYYYRKSKTYDSLLQMGRWFGFRKGWVDVCRVYTSTRFMNDFVNVGKVLEKFKSDIDDMYRQKLNPRQVGQKILYSPNLIPTAYNKMRSAQKAKVSFSGEIQQIISFDKQNIKYNQDLSKNFICSLKKPEFRQNKIVFKNVDVSKVVDYLKNYREVKSLSGYGQISIQNWIKYIELLNSKGELVNWTIVVNSLQSKIEDKKFIIGSGYEIFKPSRTIRDVGTSKNIDPYTIKVLTDPSDFKEVFDLNSQEYKETTQYDKTKKYDGFCEKDALLSIYFIDLYEKNECGFDMEENEKKYSRGPIITDACGVAAPAIWFSNTKDFDSSAVIYFANKDFIKKQEEMDYNEFGGEEND